MDMHDIMIDYLRDELINDPGLRKILLAKGAWDYLSQGHQIYHELYEFYGSNEAIDDLIHEALSEELIDY